MNPSKKEYCTVVLVICVSIIALTQIGYEVIKPSNAQGFNETSVGQSGLVPREYLQLAISSDRVLELGQAQTSGETSQGTSTQSGQQDWMDSSQIIGQESQDSTGRSIQPSWMATSFNTEEETAFLQLWIQGSAGKSQYEMYPFGNVILLLANAPANGIAVLYDLSLQSETLESKKYGLMAGYNSISLKPDQSGRHILLLNMNDQLSNAVMIDVKDSVNQMGNNAARIPAATPID